MISILPTIDTEGVHGFDPFNNFALGKCDSGEFYGALKLAEIFSRYSITATFFVDVYEKSLFGSDSIAKLCSELKDFNQDIQLHTHPGWRDDSCDFHHVRSLKKHNSYLSPEKDFMSKLSLDEQVHVLNDGINLLEKWIGEKPIAHRSGGYSINEDTFAALKMVGIPIDSSMHYNHPNSKFVLSKNQIVEYNGVIELPVTVCNLTFSKYKKLLKTDLDALNLVDLLNYVELSIKDNIKLMNFFMHSYSLLDYDFYYTKIKPSYSQESKLIAFIESTLENDNVQWVDTKSFYQSYLLDKSQYLGGDKIFDIPSFQTIIGLAVKKVWQKYDHFKGHPSP